MASYTTEVIQSIPYYRIPVGQELIVGLSCTGAVTQEQNVKFCFDISIQQIAGQVIELGIFKTTPNNRGVGFLDISAILDSYVSADNIACSDSTFKYQGAAGQPFSTHLIDRYSRADNSITFFSVKGYTEYTETSGAVAQTSQVSTALGYIINGYIKQTDLIKFSTDSPTGGAYGFSASLLEDHRPIKDTDGAKFYTNSPSTLYAGLKDYGTLSFSYHSNGVAYYQVDMYDSDDALLGNFTVERTEAFGAFDGTWQVPISGRLLYIGAFPANLIVDDNFNAQKDEMTYYTIGLYDDGDNLISEVKRVDILCPNLKDYEPIRLTWLNQFGTWDYFTFNQKSVKQIKTKGTTYQQLGGSWNQKRNRPYGYKGGKKSFRVNATETIKMSTDYLTEEHSEWFEELINSPEIYILKERSGQRQHNSYYDDSVPTPTLNQYATPCTLKTTSFTKKTVANDKLILYTFEVEKSKTLRTQAI
tara:strand:+ start:671 stop:2092 length:1422 start_codon:yes stop_codon:yes gene_type:complete